MRRRFLSGVAKKNDTAAPSPLLGRRNGIIASAAIVNYPLSSNTSHQIHHASAASRLRRSTSSFASCCRSRPCLFQEPSNFRSAAVTTTTTSSTITSTSSRNIYSSSKNNNDHDALLTANDDNDENEEKDDEEEQEDRNLSSARRVWRHHHDEEEKEQEAVVSGVDVTPPQAEQQHPPDSSGSGGGGGDDNNDRSAIKKNQKKQKNYWTSRVDQRIKLEDLIQSIQARERTGGLMRQTQLGVLHNDPGIELRHLVDNYTVTAIASALRDREDALQYAATLASEPHRHDELIEFLRQYHPRYILERRSEKNKATSDPVYHLHHENARQVLRKALMRMPRTVSTSFSKRAGVCLALAVLHGTAVLVLEKRASNLRNHPDEVCLPGGMVCDIRDETIVSTSIREMKEEIYGLEDCNVEVLGILRLNWGEVHHLTGVAVTPVVCYLGELSDSLSPSPDEVSEVFTIPLVDLVDNDNWVHKEGLAPIFVGGPHVIWGLTGYILERFRKDILRPLRREFKTTNTNNNNNTNNANSTTSDVPVGSTII
jgi:ADP-ribose pyrophosphatase YjhB (NUDIX family)